MVQRLIGWSIFTQLHQHGSIESVQLKQIWPALQGSCKRRARLLKLIELIVGKGQIVLHLRRLWSQFRSAAPRLQSCLQVSMLAVDSAEFGQLFGVVGII